MESGFKPADSRVLKAVAATFKALDFLSGVPLIPAHVLILERLQSERHVGIYDTSL